MESGSVWCRINPGGHFSIMALNEALCSWTLFWLGLGYSSLLAAQWWSLIKHGTVLWNLQGNVWQKNRTKEGKEAAGEISKIECLTETKAGEGLPREEWKMHVFLFVHIEVLEFIWGQFIFQVTCKSGCMGPALQKKHLTDTSLIYFCLYSE